jgi:hypothetical protein
LPTGSSGLSSISRRASAGFSSRLRKPSSNPGGPAQAAFPERGRALERLVADNAGQRGRAQDITMAVTSYIQDYSVPLVDAARRDPGSARDVTVIADGKLRGRRNPDPVRPLRGYRAELRGDTATKLGGGRPPRYRRRALPCWSTSRSRARRARRTVERELPAPGPEWTRAPRVPICVLAGSRSGRWPRRRTPGGTQSLTRRDHRPRTPTRRRAYGPRPVPHLP